MIQITYDPRVLSYESLLDVYFGGRHWKNRSWSTQYRSVILHGGSSQHDAAQKAISLRGAEKTVALESLRAFFRAEAYHQKYRLRMVAPLARRLAALFEDDEAFVASTLAARMNGYLAGYGTKEGLEEACREDGLPPSVLEEVRDLLRPFAAPKDGVP